MYMCVYTHTHTHTHLYTYIHVYKYIHIYILEHHFTSNLDLIFVGDFNIHIDKQDDPNTVFF